MREFKNRRNPILPLEFHIPDSEAHVMPDGKLYLYGSFDNREDVYCSDRYRVVSTPDMEHWTIHDVSLTGQEIPWFNDPDAPKYQGIDWMHPTPFIRKMLENMAADGFDTFIEVGVGTTLKKLISRILPDSKVYAVSNMEEARQVAEEVR